MEAILFIGLQGAGKSTFYRERFFHSHLRVSLDLVKTRYRERRLWELCLATRLPFVVDNTNPRATDRAVYITAAAAAGFRVVGYYFQSQVDACQARNLERPPAQQIPFKGILGTAGRLERPSRAEGFAELYYVRIDPLGGFVVEEWQNEV